VCVCVFVLSLPRFHVSCFISCYFYCVILILLLCFLVFHCWWLCFVGLCLVYSLLCPMCGASGICSIWRRLCHVVAYLSLVLSASTCPVVFGYFNHLKERGMCWYHCKKFIRNESTV